MLDIDLTGLLLRELYAYGLVFMRLGALFMMIPGIAEVYVAPRLRLSFAVLFTIAATPLVSAGAGLPPQQPMALFFDMGQELAVGFFLGFLSRVLLLGLDTAGAIIAFQSSLSNSFSMNAQTGEQSVLPAAYLTMVGAMMIFATGLHHVMLRAALDSYQLFPIKNVQVMLSSIPEGGVELIRHSFGLAMKIAAPFLIIGTVFYAVLGLLNRLMPQMMIFFIAQPAQLALGFVLMSATVTVAFQAFIQDYDHQLHALFAP